MLQPRHREHNLKPTLGFIGAGKVGSTLARLLFKAGYEIKAIYNRTPERAIELAETVDSEAVETVGEVANSADFIFLTISDDAILPIVNILKEGDLTGKAVIHTSGASSLDVMAELSKKGATLGSFHPAFPFAVVESAMGALSGATFAIEADNKFLQKQLQEIAETLEGKIILIPDGEKARYHAALVFISNYTVTLYAIAENLMTSFSSDQIANKSALMTLLRATVDNIDKEGIPDALTGPLVRADLTTLMKHLNALDSDKVKSAYINLARLSYPMLEQRGINSGLIEQKLQESE